MTFSQIGFLVSTQGYPIARAEYLIRSKIKLFNNGKPGFHATSAKTESRVPSAAFFAAITGPLALLFEPEPRQPSVESGEKGRARRTGLKGGALRIEKFPCPKT